MLYALVVLLSLAGQALIAVGGLAILVLFRELKENSLPAFQTAAQYMLLAACGNVLSLMGMFLLLTDVSERLKERVTLLVIADVVTFVCFMAAVAIFDAQANRIRNNWAVRRPGTSDRHQGAL
jgi:hypothetical protein